MRKENRRLSLKQTVISAVLALTGAGLSFVNAQAHENIVHNKKPGDILLQMECIWTQGPYAGYNYDNGFVSGERKPVNEIGTLKVWITTIPMIKGALGSKSLPYAQYEMVTESGQLFSGISDSYTSFIHNYPKNIRLGGSRGNFIWLDTVGPDKWKGAVVQARGTKEADEIVLRLNALSCTR